MIHDMPQTTAPPQQVHVVHILGALQTGGAEMALVNYLRAADRTAFRHSVVCLSREGELADLVRDLGIPVHLMRIRIRSYPTNLWELSRWMVQEEVAIVHTHMFTAALGGRLAGLMAKVPLLVTTEHGKEPWKRWHHIQADKFLGARTYRQIAVSEDVRRIRMDRDGVPEDRIVLIPNGVPIPTNTGDLETRNRIRREFGLENDSPLICSIGRVVEAKAYPDLLDAVTILKSRIPGIHWLQVGDGPEGGHLEELIRAGGLEENVTMAGRRSDISDLLGAVDLWVMSSIREGLPVALLEAMAAAKPIVATRVGGIPDAVTDGQSAKLVAPSDPIALAEGIEAVLMNPGFARDLGEEARKRATRDYGNQAVAQRVEQIYREGLRTQGIQVKP